MSKPFLKTSDFTQAFMNGVKALKTATVMVGIPASNPERSDEEEGEINNATLLFINNFGSPGQNIPARPVMEIGLRSCQAELTAEMKKAAIEALSKGGATILRYYERAGIIGSNSVKRAINDQIGIEAPAEATLKSRKSRGFKGTKALIVTGQMRNAITYVVKG